MPYLRRYSPTKLCDGAQMAIFGDFLGPVFPASRVQHISDLHSKFALGPRHVRRRHTVAGRHESRRRHTSPRLLSGLGSCATICNSTRTSRRPSSSAQHLSSQLGSAATIRAVEVAGSRLQVAPKLKSLGVTIRASGSTAMPKT